MHHSELGARRTALGCTQVELARALGVPVNTLARWERGVLPIRHGGLLRLALDALDAQRCSASNEERYAHEWPRPGESSLRG